MSDESPNLHLLPSLLRAGFILLLGVLVIAVLRTGIEARSAYKSGVAAQTAGDWESAVLHHRHAMQWYLPAFTLQSQAFEALLTIGDERVQSGDIEGALVALRSARSALMATRHLWTPMANQLPALHLQISNLMAIQTGNPDDAELFRAQLDDYESRRANPWMALGASLFFMTWLLSLGLTAWRGFDAQGQLRKRPLLIGSGASIIALALWLLSLRLA